MRGWAAALLGLLFVAVLLWFFTGAQRNQTIAVAPSGPETRPLAQPIAAASIASQSKTLPASSIPTESSSNQVAESRSAATAAPRPLEPPAVEPTAASSSLPAETVLENMRTSIRLYASMYGENPVGNNAEITKALQGENPKHANFLKSEDGNRINANGELVDIWGTPYFFHQLSAKEMEIHSAGPDRKMWTDDDLVTR